MYFLIGILRNLKENQIIPNIILDIRKGIAQMPNSKILSDVF